MTVIVRTEDLLAWTLDAASAPQHTPLRGQPCLLFHANPLCSAEAHARAQHWLSTLGCPSIAVAPTPNPLSDAADVQVTSVAEALELANALQRAPLAAAVAAQLLRITPSLSLEQGLFAESLAYSTLQAGPEYQRWLAQHRPAAAHTADIGPAVDMQREGDQLHLRLNRPQRHNAMSVEMRDALMEALQLVLSDDSIVQVTLDAAGKCFSTGGDLDEFGTAPDPVSAHLVRGLALPGRLLAACADRVTVKLHGACVGSGIEFPAFAGRITAASKTWFHLPELNFGLIPGAGGCVSIAKRMGRQRTAWWLFSGEILDSQRALEWGLIDAIA